MASRKHRKSSRKHRKGSRKHRKSQRQHHKGSRFAHQQHGGGSCAAMPLNRESFGQRGGMAPIASGDSLLLDQPTMVQAQSWGQVESINAAQGLARAQSGGRRRTYRKSRKGSRRHRKGRRGHKSRRQRGGSYPWDNSLQEFGASYTAGVPATGMNPQFSTEGSVNPLYSETRGAQY